ncbi:hypothetical protein N7G274_004416 [Stereocaulon virgatum]|uniref:Uncharacterized protein n=1 Tax=Stereocaulon virgatum TaxID=373712 RepID=A0ABR4A9T9_9LECA
MLPNLPHDSWLSLCTTAGRDIVKDRNACYEHNIIPLLPPSLCDEPAPGACKIVHFRPATVGETCFYRTILENNSNTSSFAENTGIMTPPGASSEEEGLSSAIESSSLAKSMGRVLISEVQRFSSDELNTSIDDSASRSTEVNPSTRSAEECSIATNVCGNLSNSSSLTGDDLAALNTRPTITNNPVLEFSTHLESSLPYTINRTSSLDNNITGSPAIEAQIQTANDINLTGEMGFAGDAYRKGKRVFSNENLSPKSTSIAGTVGRPTLMSTSNLGVVLDTPAQYDQAPPVPPVPPFARTLMENPLAPAFAATPLIPARSVTYNSWASPYATVPSSPTCNVIGNSWDSVSTTAPSSPRAKTNSSKQSSLDTSASNTLIGSRISPSILHDKAIDSALKALVDMPNDPDKGLPEDVYKARKIDKLRRLTGTVVQYFDGTTSSGFWRQHPEHNRVWKSKNLRCTVCPEAQNCALCKSPCCAYSGATQKVTDNISFPNEKSTAWRLVKAINMHVANGIDSPTFLKCTICNKDVCPNCCGVCPVFPCHDRNCRGCRADPWSVCEVHRED